MIPETAPSLRSLQGWEPRNSFEYLLYFVAMPLAFYKKPALVAYVTCGDPDLATTRDIILAAINAGADVIELGIPFSDPVADGPVIQRAGERALNHRTSLAQVLTLAAEVRQQA